MDHILFDFDVGSHLRYAGAVLVIIRFVHWTQVAH